MTDSRNSRSHLETLSQPTTPTFNNSRSHLETLAQPTIIPTFYNSNTFLEVLYFPTGAPVITDGSLIDQTVQALAAKGYFTGSVQDRQYAYLRSRVTDQKYKTSADMQMYLWGRVYDLIPASRIT